MNEKTELIGILGLGFLGNVHFQRNAYPLPSFDLDFTSQSGKFEQVRLQSRSKIQIKGREVVRISLKMNIAPGKAKRNKNNE